MFPKGVDYIIIREGWKALRQNIYMLGYSR